MKIRLHLGVTAAFTAVTLLMIGAVVAYLFYSSRELAVSTARSEMIAARAQTESELLNFILQTGRTVRTTAKMVEAFSETVSSPEGMGVLYSQIESLNQYYGLYFGLEESGAFYQIVKVPHDLKLLGPRDAPIPEKTRILLRSIAAEGGGRTERYSYQTDWGREIGNDSGLTNFDPRTRPWYEGAAERDGVFVTGIYRFESTGRPGITFAHRVVDRDGKLIGVVGADLTMGKVIEILDNLRIGKEGQVFLLNPSGRLIAQSGTRQSGEGLTFAGMDSEEQSATYNPIVAAAISTWLRDRREFFDFEVEAGGEGRTFLASAAPLPEVFGIHPTLGFIVPEDEFVGAIKRSTSKVLQISAVILVVAIVVTIFVSRLLSRHLRVVASEAGRISNFELEDDFGIHSNIYEVNELSSAVKNMKVGLRSFGAYVPTDLVRAILSGGKGVTVGGTARELSILFSDIEGFTAKTENLDPESLMTDLSRYFEVMEKEITAHKGTVDKYIGDAIMAIWNAPLEDADHVANACRALLACRTAEGKLNREVKSSRLLPVRTRFGLHCGRVVIGNVGSLSRMQYTAIGDTVNLASRIESLNKQYGTDSLVTEPVVAHAGESFVFREVDVVSPAGTSRRIKIFELVCEIGPNGTNPLSEEKKRELLSWKACYGLYVDRNWGAALQAFEAHLQETSRPTLVETYIDRCRGFMANPPAEDWDGAFIFDAK